MFIIVMGVSGSGKSTIGRMLAQSGKNGVIACSALRKAYRDVLRIYDLKQVRSVYLIIFSQQEIV